MSYEIEEKIELLDLQFNMKLVLLEQRTDEFFNCLEQVYIKKQCGLKEAIYSFMIPKKHAVQKALNSSKTGALNYMLIENHKRYISYVSSLTTPLKK